MPVLGRALLQACRDFYSTSHAALGHDVSAGWGWAGTLAGAKQTDVEATLWVGWMIGLLMAQEVFSV